MKHVTFLILLLNSSSIWSQSNFYKGLKSVPTCIEKKGYYFCDGIEISEIDKDLIFKQKITSPSLEEAWMILNRKLNISSIFSMDAAKHLKRIDDEIKLASKRNNYRPIILCLERNSSECNFSFEMHTEKSTIKTIFSKTKLKF